MLTASVALLLTAAVLVATPPVQAQSLGGSLASMREQNRQARRHDFTFLRTATQVRKFVDLGLLVPLGGNRDYDLHAVSFPYARPETKLFVERLSSQYRAACGERLVVTSLTRPISRQPPNASSRSVHPTGMALDLRRSSRRRCRSWLEETLLYLERRDILEATRERHPPHYHVALYPAPYRSYVARITGQSETRLVAGIAGDTITYQVRRQDTLWRISRRYDTTPEALQGLNGLRSTTIYPGQVLKVPTTAGR